MCDHSYLVLMAKQNRDLKQISIKELNVELDKITTDKKDVLPPSVGTKEEKSEPKISESTLSTTKSDDKLSQSSTQSNHDNTSSQSICSHCEDELDAIYSITGCEHNLCSEVFALLFILNMKCIESQEEFDVSNEKNKIQCPGEYISVLRY